MSAERHVGDRYVLKTGELGAKRLALLNEVYGNSSKELLSRAGVGPGSTVVDIGCGTGNVSMELARLVGPRGRVTGVDASAEQIEIARDEARSQGMSNVEFTESNVYQTSLADNRFDFAYARLILCHLQRPRDAMQEMLRVVKPGGVIICEDLDISSLQTYPRSSAYERIVELSLKLAEQRGVDYCRGRQIPSIMVELGLTPTVSVFQPAFLLGEVKRVWEYTFLEAAPHIVEAGLTTNDEIESLATELARIAADETITVFQSRFVQSWAAKLA